MKRFVFPYLPALQSSCSASVLVTPGSAAHKVYQWIRSQVGGNGQGERRGSKRQYSLLLLFCCLAILLPMLGACSFFSRSGKTSLNLDFAQILPQGWKAIGPWQEISIDGDSTKEYLLLFSYDNGQIGAVIYDSQIASDYVGIVDVSKTPVPTATVPLVAIPLQSFGYYRPYRLLPNYWSYIYGGDVGQGVIAEPGQENNVAAYEVGNLSDVQKTAQPATSNPGSAKLSAASQPKAELVIRGGETHLTFAWWKDVHQGYGVTQLYAPGGFRGVNWQNWQKSPTPITSISGLFPLADYRGRSLFCREVLYRRNQGTPPNGANANGDTALQQPGEASFPAIWFSHTDMGIKFCKSNIPIHPFYPEGVVLAYLLQSRPANGSAPARDLADLMTPDVTVAQVDADMNYGLLAQEKVADIETYPTIPLLPSSVETRTFAPTTAVCVELEKLAGASNPRWLMFTLRYQPPDLQQRIPDRWTVSGATLQPPPLDGNEEGYCQAILARSVP